MRTPGSPCGQTRSGPDLQQNIIEPSVLIERLRAARRPFHDAYYAMYSSVYGGIVTDPVLMLLPIDDHMVHRGDGVFEAMRCVAGSLYSLPQHLARLVHSAQAIDLRLPVETDGIAALAIETVRAGGRRDCVLRIFVSRGPGSFEANPYSSARPQLYAVVTAPPRRFMDKHPEGARLITSKVAAKLPPFATVKSCNYLPNVLMKKEAVDAGVDFVAGFDERGLLTEGATENIGIVSRDGELRFPGLDRILHGTTMLRAAELAGGFKAAGMLSGVRFCDVTREDIFAAREMLVVGTTVEVAAAVQFDGRPVADGKPGPVAGRLAEAVARDMRENRDRLTPTGL